MLKIATDRNKNLTDWDGTQTCGPGEICWFDLQSPSEEEMQAVARLTGAPAALLQGVMDTQASVSASAAEGWLLLITRTVDRSDSRLRPQHLGLLVGEKFLVSVHEEDLPEIQEVSHEWSVEPVSGGSDLLYFLLDATLDRLFPMLDDIEDALYEVEENILQGQMEQRILFGILRTSRELLVIRKVGSALRETANTILRHTPQQESRWSRFQEAYDHASRVVDIAEMLHEVASNSIDANLATVSNQLNAVMKTLTIVATILMTVSLISGIFGMNFAFPAVIKEQTLRGFWIAVGAMAASVGGLLLWFRRKRYLA